MDDSSSLDRCSPNEQALRFRKVRLRRIQRDDSAEAAADLAATWRASTSAMRVSSI